MHKTLATLLLATVAGPGAVFATGAVLSQVRGDVKLQTAALGGARYSAQPLQIVAPGSTLSLSEKARAVVICSGDRAVELIGPREWQLGSASCQAGKPVAAGTYSRLVPSQGRGIVFHGSLLTEAPSRSDDESGKVPALLRPRSPQRLTVLIAEASPTIVWAAVRRALSYELVLTTGAREDLEEVFVVERPDCRNDSHSAIAQTCTASWPWSPLRPGEEVELRVRARTSDPDRPERTTAASKLRLVDAGIRSTVEKRLNALAADPLPPATHELLRAAVYAEAKLYNEAADALAAALEESPSAMLAVRLADLYLGLGQSSAALRTYGRAEQLLPGEGADEVRAALYLGRGRLYARGEDAALATRDLRRAAKYFRKVGHLDMATAAEAEAERAGRS